MALEMQAAFRAEVQRILSERDTWAIANYLGRYAFKGDAAGSLTQKSSPSWRQHKETTLQTKQAPNTHNTKTREDQKPTAPAKPPTRGTIRYEPSPATRANWPVY